jgi:hypothetical protein
MSRTTRSHPRRPLVVPGLVLIGLAASAATAQTAQAQSPSPTRALLNRMSAVTYRVLAAGNPSPTAIDAERAVLHRSIAAPRAPIVTTRPHEEVRPVDGEQALLPRGPFRPAGERGRESGRESGRGSDVTSSKSVYYATFTGVGAEGRDMVWRGAVAGATVGALTLRLAREGQDTDTAQPVWPVEGTIAVVGEDPRRAFTAKVRGTIHWPTKRLRLVGDVSVGALRGARVEQTGQLNFYDLGGELRVTPATIASTR